MKTAHESLLVRMSYSTISSSALVPLLELEPVTRTFMREIKTKRDEEKRRKGIRDAVKWVYSSAILLAETTHHTAFLHFLVDPFYKENLNDILYGLRGLFPDCYVTHANLHMGKDGKLHNVDTADRNILRLIGQQPNGEYIIIDWS